MRHKVPTEQLLYNLEIERTIRSNNNIRRRISSIRRLFKEAREASSTTVKSTTDSEEEVDMAKQDEGQHTLRDYATFMAPLNVKNIAR